MYLGNSTIWKIYLVFSKVRKNMHNIFPGKEAIRDAGSGKSSQRKTTFIQPEDFLNGEFQ